MKIVHLEPSCSMWSDGQMGGQTCGS